MKSGIATLTSKGQLTVPVEVRDALHLQAGDRLEFILDGDGLAYVRALNKGPEAFLDALEPRRPDPAYASDDEAIAAAVVERDEQSRRKAPVSRDKDKAA